MSKENIFYNHNKRHWSWWHLDESTSEFSRGGAYKSEAQARKSYIEMFCHHTASPITAAKIKAARDLPANIYHYASDGTKYVVQMNVKGYKQLYALCDDIAAALVKKAEFNKERNEFHRAQRLVKNTQ